MSTITFSRDLLTQYATLTSTDHAIILQRRRPHNQLGFAYQLAFVRIANRFPQIDPFEIVDSLLHYVAIQLSIPADEISHYAQRQPTVSHHQRIILDHLELNAFGDASHDALERYVFDEACRLEQTTALMNQDKLFLRHANILQPAEITLRRLVHQQRQAARTHIYSRIDTLLTQPLKSHIDEWLKASDKHHSPLFRVKQPAGRPSPKAMKRLVENLLAVERSGLLSIDLSWLNNNYQRSLANYAQRCSVARLNRLLPARRYAVLTCFFQQLHHTVIDQLIDMQHKLLTTIYQRADQAVDDANRKQRRQINSALHSFQTMTTLLLDEQIADAQLRQATFDAIERDQLVAQSDMVNRWLTGTYSDSFNLVKQRYSYIRRFSPVFINAVDIYAPEEADSDILDAITLLKQLNAKPKRPLPDDAPVGFVPKKWLKYVQVDGQLNRAAWECVLLTVIRDELRVGNLHVRHSKRFTPLADFFIADAAWKQQRDRFFQQAGLPSDPDRAVEYLTKRLHTAYDTFLSGLAENDYAAIENENWKLSVDSAETLTDDDASQLKKLRRWLKRHRRKIRLPELLVEVDNDLHFSSAFLLPNQARDTTTIYPIVATIMAHGCNIGLYTMSDLSDAVTYEQLSRLSDWHFTTTAQRQALAAVVNGITQLNISTVWGSGNTSSSDGQRFRLQKQVLQQTWSQRMNDYALEFYTFIADNYAPFYSTVIECNDRDAAYVLDGLLYNEGDLSPVEHFTDTHGYTDINFAAFAMLGRRFSPRLRGIQHQRIYRLNDEYDYGKLSPLVARPDRIIRLHTVHERWDKIAHFYASLAAGHVTASTALKRLVASSGKNRFYRANRELGRLFKTEHILHYLSDASLRQRVRRGLLKSEQLHALARRVAFGKQGTIEADQWRDQRTIAGCLTLIMACIIYWQAKEMSRAIQDGDPAAASVNLDLLSHISPIHWENVIIYGEYFFDPDWLLA